VSGATRSSRSSSSRKPPAASTFSRVNSPALSIRSPAQAGPLVPDAADGLERVRATIPLSGGAAPVGGDGDDHSWRLQPGIDGVEVKVRTSPRRAGVDNARNTVMVFGMMTMSFSCGAHTHRGNPIARL
jgi:hypothetical protein